MKIKHYPILDEQAAIKHFSEKDGVEVSYICTTDLKASDTPVDIFYRETPHPDFGNKYFGLYYDHYRDAVMICDADIVEELEFGITFNDNGELEYSQSHHDFKQFENGNMIDGGRVYTRGSGQIEMYKIKDGKWTRLVDESQD